MSEVEVKRRDRESIRTIDRSVHRAGPLHTKLQGGRILSVDNLDLLEEPSELLDIRQRLQISTFQPGHCQCMHVFCWQQGRQHVAHEPFAASQTTTR